MFNRQTPLKSGNFVDSCLVPIETLTPPSPLTQSGRIKFVMHYAANPGQALTHTNHVFSYYDKVRPFVKFVSSLSCCLPDTWQLDQDVLRYRHRLPPRVGRNARVAIRWTDHGVTFTVRSASPKFVITFNSLLCA